MKNAYGHGIYTSALKDAFEILENEHDKCALSLFFLSDGRPSDAGFDSRFPSSLYDLVSSNCSKFGERLTFATVGFGIDDEDFDVLRNINSIAVNCGTKATFAISNIDQSCLGTVLSSVISSVADSRTHLSRLNGHEKELREPIDNSIERFMK